MDRGCSPTASSPKRKVSRSGSFASGEIHGDRLISPQPAFSQGRSVLSTTVVGDTRRQLFFSKFVSITSCTFSLSLMYPFFRSFPPSLRSRTFFPRFFVFGLLLLFQAFPTFMLPRDTLFFFSLFVCLFLSFSSMQDCEAQTDSSIVLSTSILSSDSAHIVSFIGKCNINNNYYCTLGWSVLPRSEVKCLTMI